MSAQAEGELRAAVALLVSADDEYDAARRDWDAATAGDPLELNDEQWKRVAQRFESAIASRASALERVGGML